MDFDRINRGHSVHSLRRALPLALTISRVRVHAVCMERAPHKQLVPDSNSSFIPIKACSGDSGYMQHAVYDLIGLLQDWIDPILPLEPMRRF